MKINLQNKYTPLLISALLLVVMVTTITAIGLRWRADWQLSHQINHQPPPIANTNITATLIASLPEQHLFGQSIANGILPITNLQLKLVGIVDVNDEPKDSKAYISIAGQPDKIFQVGDRLPYGVIVYDITPDSVILQNDGHLEKLTLERQQLVFKKIEEVA